MEWLNWKTILALAVFAMPLAYCEIDAQKQRSAERIACIENFGEWRLNSCRFDQ